MSRPSIQSLAERLPSLLGVALLAAAGVACTPAGVDASAGGAQVSAINYTDGELDAVAFIDPQTKAVAGGPGARPFSGTGTMCCYSLPHQWRPGLKVQVRYDWWDLQKNDRGTEQLRTLEIPEYSDGEGQTLWALFYPGDVIEVVATKFDPGHPQWPGREKSWPVQTREFRLKEWQEERDRLVGMHQNFEQLAERPQPSDLEELWRDYTQRSPHILQGMSGPEDIGFRKYVMSRFRALADDMRQRIIMWEKAKP